MEKKIIKIVITIMFLIVMSGNVSVADAATFDDINQSDVFLNQQGRSTCTLVSSAMMMRRAAILQGNPNWSSITEASLKGSAWDSNAGLKWSFSYAGISVGSAKLPTGAANINILKNLLAEHPEGVVLHYKGAPHAVLLTDYTDGVFYCSDPLASRPKARIPLSNAYKVTSQNATRYWYVTSPKCYLSEIARVSEPTGYSISINDTLFSTKQNISVTIDPYDNNIENYTFVIMRNGLWYRTIDNGSSNTLTYNINQAGNYQIYGVIRNAGGTFSGAVDNGGLSFEVTDQILTGFNYGTSANRNDFDASKGIIFSIYAHNNIEVTDYKFEIYKKTGSQYEYYTTVDNGSSNTYLFKEEAGEYKLKIIVSNRVSQVSDEVYLKAVSKSVSGVDIIYDKDEYSNFAYGKIKNAKLRAEVEPGTALNKRVKWESSNPDIIKIDNNGNMTCCSNGFSLITVRTEDGNYTDRFPVKINGFGFQYGDINEDGVIDVSDLVKLRKYVQNIEVPTDIEKGILDLDGDGKLTDKDIELIRMYIQQISYIFPVESMINNISIAQLPYKTEYTVGEETDLSGLKLNVQYNNGQTNIVTSNYSYSVISNQSGKRKITISYCEDDIVKQVSFDVNESKGQQTLSGTKEYKKTYGDADFYLDTKVIEGDGILSYKSSDSEVAEVDSYGKIKIKSSGSTIIRVNCSETEQYERAVYEVKIEIDKVRQIISGTSMYKKNKDDSFFWLDTNVIKGDGTLSYKISDDNVAIVTQEGKVWILSEGKAVITVTASETENYKKEEFSIILEIKEDENKPTVSPTEKPTVTPTVSPTSSPAITPTAKPTATPTGSPTVKPTAVPTVSPDDNYYDEEDDVEDPVIYAKKSVTKHIGDKDFDIDNGIDSDGEVSYESSNNKVATVDRNGSVRIKGCGIAIITIFVDETENFYMDTKDVKVTVLPSNIKKFKVKSMENGIKCTWKKMNFNNVKCIIQASENRKFKKPVTAKPYSELKKGYWKGVGLKRNKVYYIRIRQIAKFSNKQFKYGKWSKVIKVKIK